MITLSSRVSKISQKVPLHLVLVGSFILQTFAAVGLTGWLSLSNGQHAVNNLTTQLPREVSARLQKHLDTYLSLPTSIAQFNVKAAQISPNSQTFILERNGQLVATSTGEAPFIISPENNKPKRIQAIASQNAKTRQTAQYLAARFGNMSPIQSAQQLEFSLDNQRQFVQVVPYFNRRGLDWLVVMVVPKADFRGEMNANRRNTILLCFLALVLATAIGVYTLRWIAKPIRRLSLASRALADGASQRFATRELHQKVEIEGVEEVRVIAEFFNQMDRELRKSFTVLEKTNDELEIRVEERTAELKEGKKTADAANRTKSLFLAKRHELRTPLNAIVGFTQIMTRETSSTLLQKDYLAIIKRSGEDLLSLINEILQLSKIEAGRMPLQEDSFNLFDGLDAIYENGGCLTKAPSGSSFAELSAFALAAMPAEWVAALHQAAREADRDLILGLAEEISGSNATLSKALTDLVNSYQFEKSTDCTGEALAEEVVDESHR